MIGLRFTRHVRVIGSAMMTLAFLLAMATTMEAGLARGDAVTLVMGIIFLEGFRVICCGASRPAKTRAGSQRRYATTCDRKGPALLSQPT